MLSFRLYLVISTLLIVTQQKDISMNPLDITKTSSILDIEKNPLEISENSTTSRNLTSNLAVRRRVSIWFAVPRNVEEVTNATECGNSADDFPNFFAADERKNGAIIVHIFLCTYCFILVAVVCDNYFLPCVELICESLNLSEDVAAATFMAIATSAPELFVNIIGTFITNSDIGIGTIVGSSMFNTLGVASIGGLAASSPIQIAWWPVTRDIILYILAIICLVVMTWDGMVFWYEGLILFTGYFIYFTVMIMNDKFSKLAHSFIGRFKRKGKKSLEASMIASKLSVCTISSRILDNPRAKYTEHRSNEEQIPITGFGREYSIYRFPKGSWLIKTFFIYCWPLKFVTYYTIPDCRKHPKLYPVTFAVCIIWIGVNSYIVSWLMSIIGVTFGIPDAVLGLTFLAVGGCLPESFSIAILSRKGEGRMGVSNALGANTMNILLSLGLPWFIKTLVLGADADAFIYIESGSLEYTILGLVAVALTLYISLLLNKFKLSKVSGAITITCYFGYLTLAIVADMVIFETQCL